MNPGAWNGDVADPPRILMERDGETLEFINPHMEWDEETLVLNPQMVLRDRTCSTQKLFCGDFDICEHGYLAQNDEMRWVRRESVRYTGSKWRLVEWENIRARDKEIGEPRTPYDPSETKDRIEYAVCDVEEATFRDQVMPEILKRYNPQKPTELVLHILQKNQTNCLALLDAFLAMSTDESRPGVCIHFHGMYYSFLDELDKVLKPCIRSFAFIAEPADQPKATPLLKIILKRLCNLEVLHLSHMWLINDPDAPKAGQLICEVDGIFSLEGIAQKLKKLSLHHVMFDFEFTLRFNGVLSRSPIETFEMDACTSLPLLQIDRILEALAKHTSVRHIVLANMTDALAFRETQALLVEIVKTRTPRSSVDLSNNKLGVDRCSQLVDAFENACLGELVLYNNRCGKAVFDKLAALNAEKRPKKHM